MIKVTLFQTFETRYSVVGWRLIWEQLEAQNVVFHNNLENQPVRKQNLYFQWFLIVCCGWWQPLDQPLSIYCISGAPASASRLRPSTALTNTASECPSLGRLHGIYYYKTVRRLLNILLSNYAIQKNVKNDLDQVFVSIISFSQKVVCQAGAPPCHERDAGAPPAGPAPARRRPLWVAVKKQKFIYFVYLYIA